MYSCYMKSFVGYLTEEFVTDITFEFFLATVDNSKMAISCLLWYKGFVTNLTFKNYWTVMISF